MKRDLTRLAAGSAAVALCLSAWPSVAAPTYTTFDPPNSIETVPESINDGGEIAGYYEDSSDVFHGFVRAPDGTITSFDPPGAISTFATGINTAGVIVGYYQFGQGVEQSGGFIRTPDGTITTFAAEKSAFRTYPGVINNEGTIAGAWTPHYRDCCGFVRAADGKTKSFRVVHQSATVAASINDGGTVVGYYTIGRDGSAGFVRNPDGSISTFQVSGSQTTYPNCINKAGTIAGNYSDTTYYQSFLRTSDGTITAFVPPGAIASQALGINKRGSIVGVYFATKDSPGNGYLRTGAARFVKVKFPRSANSVARAINDKDVIAGTYDTTHGFVRSP